MSGEEAVARREPDEPTEPPAPLLRPLERARRSAPLRRLIHLARRHPRRSAALVAAAAVGVALAGRKAGPTAPGGGALALAEVRQGPFRASLTETGTLQALRSASYSSQIQSNQAKIVSLAPEGRLVEEGDLLILFDAAPFQEEIRRSQLALAQAQADLEKARQEQQLQRIENQEQIAAARNKVQRSELELRDVEQGKGLLKEEEARAAVANAERELAKAEQNHRDLEPLLAEGFITKLELERAEQLVQKAREDLELARRREQTLVEYGRPIELSQAQTDTDAARETARQLASAAAHRLEQKRAEVAAAESRIAEASARLAQAQQQLARTEVRADVAGIVVYREQFLGSERRKPQVGDQVWANQPLLILPDVSRMVVETRVRETDIHRVAKQQQVAVRVDAYPDMRLTGRVTLIGALAETEPERRGAKYFGVTVEIDQSEPRLRPGMTARVEILAEERDSAVFVPVDAVFEKEGRHVSYVAEGGDLVEREVVLGPSSSDHVVIESGLEPGERVSLVDPLAAPADLSAPAPPL